jgi:CRP-like cAMP-binding protein/HEAT repeat protein
MLALLYPLQKLFPIQAQEWPKALLLLSVATLWGASVSLSRVAAEGMFLSHLGVTWLPWLLLVNPLLMFALSLLYSTYAERLAPHRLMIAVAVLPMPLIVLLRLVLLLKLPGLYFLLYTIVLAYAAVLMLGWSIYLATHYDVQEAKRLLPFISSGLLLGGILGGLGTVVGVRLLGPENILLLWAGTLGAGALLVRAIAQRYPSMDPPKILRNAPRPGLHRTLADGLAAIRASRLFTAIAVTTLTTMAAMQVLDFEYSQRIRAAFPDGAALTAFLGLVDGLATGIALLLQWFVVPWGLRRWGVQGINLWYPVVLLLAFAALASAPLLPAVMVSAAIFGRFTRMHLLPTLRGTPYALLLNAAPRKTASLVRSFSTAMVVPMGQGSGALLLLGLKSLDMPWLLPAVGCGMAAICLLYTYRQNTAYGTALLDVLRADRIHLLDLEDDALRHLDAQAVEAISARLSSDDDEVCLAAVGLLRTIGSLPACAALRAHLPCASPAVAAAILTVLAESDTPTTIDVLRPALESPHGPIRLAALRGLHRLGDPTLPQYAVTLLTDPDVQVQAEALTLVLTDPSGPAHASAQRLWDAMLESPEPTTQVAALSVCASLSEPSQHACLYRALEHADVTVRCAALHGLLALAEAGRLTHLEPALLRMLTAEELDVRQGVLRILAVLGTDEALTHMLQLLDDPQPTIRDTLSKALAQYGQRAASPLVEHLRAPQVSLIAKETALITLARLHGVEDEQLLGFWETELREVYLYKLILACLETQPASEAYAFLRLALRNAHDQILSLLVQVLAVWTSPDVARLVESGLHATERSQRASALEALESLSARRFTRLLLPILAPTEGRQETWRLVAQQQWQLTPLDLPTLVTTCLQCPHKWIVIGALLAGQAQAAALGSIWPALLRRSASATDADIRETAQRIIGHLVAPTRWAMPLPELLLFLKRVPLCSSMHLEQLRTVAACLTTRTAQAGEVIFRQGDTSREIYIIVSGQVHIVQQRPGGVSTLVTLPAGEFFGDIALFGGRPRSAGAIAATDVTLLTMGPEHVRQMIFEEPALSFEIFRALSARIRRFDEQIQAAV